MSTTVNEPLRAVDIEARAIEWLWPIGATDSGEDAAGPVGIIPKRNLSVFAGKRDRGKGLVWVRAVADLSVAGVRCLVSAPEDNPHETIVTRLNAAGANLENVVVWDFALPRDFDEFIYRVVEQQIGYVVADPFAAHLTDGIKRHSDNVRDVLTPLTRMIRDLELGFTIVDHVLKRVPSDGDLHDAIGGNSSGLVAACRIAWIAGRDPADNEHLVLAAVKHNITADGLPSISFGLDTKELQVRHPKSGELVTREFPYLTYKGEIEFDAHRLVSNEVVDDRRGPAADRLEATRKFLIDYLYAAGQPMPAGVVKEDATQHGFKWRTVRRAADEAHIVRSSQGRGCTWALPDDLRQVLDEQRAAETGLGMGIDLNDDGMIPPDAWKKLLGESDETEPDLGDDADEEETDDE